MKRIITIAAVALMLSGSTAKAAHVHARRTTVVRNRVAVRTGGVTRGVVGARAPLGARGYFRANAVRFNGGYYYLGRNHSHWSSTRYSPAYKTTIYYDPGLTTWFYWSGAAGRYYPVSYWR